MNPNFVPSSPKLLSGESNIARKALVDIPFDLIPVGMSVTIPIDAIKENILRSTVCQQSKRLKRTFRCMKHKEHGIYEIGRLADPEPTEPVARIKAEFKKDAPNPQWGESSDESEG